MRIFARLVVDRFGDYLVVQIATPGHGGVRDAIVEALVQVLKPAGVLVQRRRGARKARFTVLVEAAFGEGGLSGALKKMAYALEAPVWTWAEDRWFYDHRMNRARLAAYVEWGKRV